MTAYLTIDDAPSEHLSEKLEVLEENDVPALFFCEGRRLADNSDDARRAVEAGFHLGNHAYSHRHASDLSVEELDDEIERTESLLEDVYDRTDVTRPARLFRFPYGDKGGDQSESFQQLLAEQGFRPPDPEQFTYEWYQDRHAGDRDWYWTISVKDWEVETRAELEAQVESVADRLAHPSPDIILFHDGGNTPELFRAFVELLLERGVELADPIDLLD